MKRVHDDREPDINVSIPAAPDSTTSTNGSSAPTPSGPRDAIGALSTSVSPAPDSSTAMGDRDASLETQIQPAPDKGDSLAIGDPLLPIPFRGGANTENEVANLSMGQFSMVQDMRARHPGFEKRKGQRKLHDTADSTNKVVSISQFNKSRVTDNHFLALMSDGDILDATNAPPGVATSAVFGSELWSGTTAPKPPSWGIIGDMLVFSNGVDQHQIYAGAGSYIEKLVVYRGSAAPPTVPSFGEDFSVQISDGTSTTVAVLDSLDVFANNECVFICTSVPVNSLTWTVSAANGTVSTATLYYKKTNNTWADTSMTDGTKTGTTTLAQTGAMTWTIPTDEQSSYMYGVCGFWYQLRVSVQLDAEVEISGITFAAPFQDLRNVWDGTPADAVEVQVEGTTQYARYAAGAVSLSELAADKKIYIASADPIEGIYIDPGSVPNATGTVIGSLKYWNGSSYVTTAGNFDADPTNLTFVDGGGGADTLTDSGNGFVTDGFTAGSIVTITGATTAANDGTYIIVTVAAGTLTFATGSWTAGEAGAAGMSVTAIQDGTSGMSQPGWITFPRNTGLAYKRQFGTTKIYAYWYELVWDSAIAADTVVYIQTMPYFDIGDFGKIGTVNGIWKGRLAVSFSQYPEFFYVSAQSRPMVFNGFDFSIRESGDGRPNPIVSMINYHNEMMVWQKEIGSDGGALTLYQGFNPDTYGELMISANTGSFSAKSAVVVDGVLTSTKTDETIKTLAYFISHYGVCVSDGQLVSVISDDIRNYFDPQETECIRDGYEDEMWIAHDTAENVLRLGLVSGSSATLPNIFPVYDLVDRVWSFDSPEQELACVTEVRAGTGNVSVIQVGGGIDDGFVYQLNYGTNDVSTAIDGYVTVELDVNGYEMVLDEILLRMKVQAAGSVIITPYKNGVGQSTITKLMTAEETSEIIRRHRFFVGHTDDHLSLKFQNATTSQSLYLESLMLNLTAHKNR